MRKIRTNLLSPIDKESILHLKDHVIAISGEVIKEIRPYDPALDADAEDQRSRLALPGLIDVHVHLSQYRIRGQYEPSLLSWLDRHVFPEEERSRDTEFAAELADEFFKALFRQGTTTSVVYTAPFAEACEAAFASAEKHGARALIGMTLMDRNSPASLLQTTEYAIGQSIRLHEKYTGAAPLLSYIFTPRFALSCSRELMQAVGAYARENHAWIQTHLSENPEEIRLVKEMFGAESYTDVYRELGLLGPRTILAHAIHISDMEIDVLGERDCRVAHCPDSNFFLKSGEFDYGRLDSAGLKIGIGSDVAAGSSLSMLYHAKIANYRQSSLSLKPAELLYLITLGNARLLDMDRCIGSLEAGKQADLILLDASGLPAETGELCSALVFHGHECQVAETVIAGRTVHHS